MSASVPTPPTILLRVELDDDDPSVVIEDVADFVWRLTDDGSFRFDEMPSVAIMSVRVEHFFNEVNNGGLSQWYTNNGCATDIVENTEAALRAMKASNHAEIVADFRRLIGDPDHEALIAAWRERESVDPAVDALDDRFFRLGSDELQSRQRDWLVGSGALTVVTEEAYWAGLAALKAHAAVARRAK